MEEKDELDLLLESEINIKRKKGFFEIIGGLFALCCGLFAIFGFTFGPIMYLVNGISNSINADKINDNYIESLSYTCEIKSFLEVNYYDMCYDVEGNTYKKKFIQHEDFSSDYLTIYYNKKNPSDAYFIDSDLELNSKGLVPSIIVLCFIGCIVCCIVIFSLKYMKRRDKDNDNRLR